MKREQVFNLPNLITLLRVGSIPLLMGLLYSFPKPGGIGPRPFCSLWPGSATWPMAFWPGV